MTDVRRVLAAILCCAGVVMPAAAHAEAKVVVLPLEFAGNVVPVDQDVLGQRLLTGLKGTGMALIEGESVRKALAGQRGPCGEACRRALAGTLEGRYVVGGRVEGEHEVYRIELWLADGYSGKTLVQAPRRCDICGITELATTMDLAASTLHAKLEALAGNPARFQVRTVPPGAMVYVDGDAVGNAPRELQLTAGEHEIAAEAEGYEQARRTVVAVEGASERVDLQLEQDTGRLWWRRAGWIAMGAGLAATVAGAVLIAIDGKETDCTATSDRTNVCDKLRNTVVPGAISLGAGIAAIGSGLYLLLTHQQPAERRALTVVPQGAGLGVHATF